jgi:hypothetical protein
MSDFALQWLLTPAVGILVVTVLLVSPGPGADSTVAYSDLEVDATYQQLDACLKATQSRMAYKEELIQRLIVGELTLEDVSTEFLRMNKDTAAMGLLRHLYSGASDEEVSARNVLEYVRQRKLPPGPNAQVFGRLRREFVQTYGSPYPDAD